MIASTANSVLALDQSYAREIGALNGRTGSAQITDAHVALVALHSSPSLVLTADADDIVRLARAIATSVTDWK